MLNAINLQRAEAPVSESVKIIGFFWMERADWEALLPHFTDRNKLHTTYEDWREAVEKGIQLTAIRGGNVIKVRARPDEFLRWCRAEGLEVDSAARIEYANQHAAAERFTRLKPKH